MNIIDSISRKDKRTKCLQRKEDFKYWNRKKKNQENKEEKRKYHKRFIFSVLNIK